VVCVANVLAKSVLPDTEAPPPYPEDHSDSLQMLGVDSELEKRICQAVSARFTKVLELFGM
jgi:hypothetical protein